jgi:putative membrane protein
LFQWIAFCNNPTKKVMKKVMMLAVAAIFGLAATAQDTTAQQNTTGQSDTAAQQDAADQQGTMDMNGKIGNMTAQAFMALNQKGAAAVAAIKPTKTPLSASDKKLMLQVAAGGQRQLAISQAVLDNVTNPQVRLLAQSEVEEQTGVAAKLQEIADAKGITLPSGPADSVQAMVSRVQDMSGADLDAFYINESGVKGHQLLQKTMSTVNANAKDASLKKLAAATLPVIRTHLSVSRDLQRTMGTNSSASR